MFQIFFDDSTRNIASGKAAGFHTVIVRRPAHLSRHSCSKGKTERKTF
jgi:beta-phosphoglucomutase-like phosphatase (HAD superfamily)